MTLLEDWDAGKHLVSDADIRRALAIAQAAEELRTCAGMPLILEAVNRRADELLAAREQRP